jgi:hypothetical protein
MHEKKAISEAYIANTLNKLQGKNKNKNILQSMWKAFRDDLGLDVLILNRYISPSGCVMNDKLFSCNLCKNKDIFIKHFPMFADVYDSPYWNVFWQQYHDRLYRAQMHDKWMRYSPREKITLSHYDFKTAIKFSALVYKFDYIPDHLKPVYFKGIGPHFKKHTPIINVIHTTSPACISVRLNKTMFIIFRGTKTSDDVIADVKVKLHPLLRNKMIPLEKSDACATEDQPMIHVGFLQYFVKIKKLIEAVHNKHRKTYDRIVFCGHSLGSGIAQIAALYFKTVHPKLNIACYTCATVCIGNNCFNETFNQFVTDSFHIVNPNDPFTLQLFCDGHVKHTVDLDLSDQTLYGYLVHDDLPNERNITLNHKATLYELAVYNDHYTVPKTAM